MKHGRADHKYQNKEGRIINRKRSRELNSLDSQAYQDAATLAAQICETQIAFVDFYRREGRWFNSQATPDVITALRDFSFSSQVLLQGSPCIVTDATKDERLSGDHLVNGEFHLRFCAAIPIFTEGMAVGTICVLDKEPRTIDDRQIQSLQVMGRQVSAYRQLRLKTKTLEPRDQEIVSASKNDTESSDEWTDRSQRFQHLFHSLPIGCCLIDRNGIVLEWNAMNESIFEFRANEIINTNIFDSLPILDRSTAKEDFALFVNSGGRVVGEQITLNKKDGSEVTVLLSAVPYYGPDGTIQGVVGTNVDISDRLETERELRKLNTLLEAQFKDLVVTASRLDASENFVRTLANAMPGLIAYWDKELKCRFANRAYVEWFGKEPSEMIGIQIQELLGERVFRLNEPHILGALSGKAQNFERTLVKADGSVGFTLANYIPDIAPNGVVNGFYVLVSDVTPMKKAQTELRLAASVFESMTEGIIVTDKNGIILSVNPAFTGITGFSEEESVGNTIDSMTSDKQSPEFYAEVANELAAKGWWEGETWNRRKNGESFLQLQTITAVRDSDEDSVRYITVFRDITDRWRKEERLRRYALYDHLTNLPNRQLLMERMSQLIAQAHREDRSVVVMFCDLDGFKAINDVHGHAAGDSLLVSVARRLEAEVRKSDTVARIGGDEFVILLDNPKDLKEVKKIAERIIGAIGIPFVIDDKSVGVGISIGIVSQFSKDLTAAEILQQADSAMYATKKNGKNRYTVIEPVSHPTVP